MGNEEALVWETGLFCLGAGKSRDLMYKIFHQRGNNSSRGNEFLSVKEKKIDVPSL